MIKHQAYQPLNKAHSMTWAQRPKRVFAIEIEKGEKCGGKAGLEASVESVYYRIW